MKLHPEMLRKMVLYIAEHLHAHLKSLGDIISNDYIRTYLIAGNYHNDIISSQYIYYKYRVQRLSKDTICELSRVHLGGNDKPLIIRVKI